MERRQFEHLVEQLHKLTTRQRDKLLGLLAEAFKREKAVEVIEQAVRPRLVCPRCGAADPYRMVVLMACSDTGVPAVRRRSTP